MKTPSESSIQYQKKTEKDAGKSGGEGKSADGKGNAKKNRRQWKRR